MSDERATPPTKERGRAERDKLVLAELCWQVMVERDALREALKEARAYVFNQTQGADWRAETAADVLSRVDAALERP